MTAKFDPQLMFLAAVNAVLLVVGAVASAGLFIDPYNLQSMASQLPELALLAIGVMLAMSSGNGGIDLSGIALANLSGVLSALLVQQFVSVDDAPLLFSATFAIVAIIIGLLGGLFNGALIARVGLTPILCTLGTQLFFTGLCVVASNGRSITVGSPDPLSFLGNDNVFGVPVSFAIFCLVALLVGAMLKFTPFGVRLMLMGTNPTAARFAGFPKSRMLVMTYALSGALAGLAGVIIAARNVNVKWDYGQSYLLIAILIVVMAGVKPEGGHGRMICLFLSATALQLLSSLLNFLDISNFFRDFAWGFLLLLFLAVVRFQLLESLFPLLGRFRVLIQQRPPGSR
jgi:simple sugar transport system permease protein